MALRLREVIEMDYTPLWLSLKTALTATILSFGLGIGLAYVMVFRQIRYKSLVDGLVILPMVLPPTVVGLGLLLLFGKNGPLGRLLLEIGHSVVFSWSATVIAATTVAVPLMYKTARGAFEQIDSNIVDAARTLGLSELNTFWRVIIPNSLPGVSAGVVLSFARAIGEFGATLMLAGNIPGKTQTIPLAIYIAVESGNMETAIFWSGLIIAFSLGMVVVLNRWPHLRPRPCKYGWTSTRGEVCRTETCLEGDLRRKSVAGISEPIHVGR
jgi:molybdate transport system permease protein